VIAAVIVALYEDLSKDFARQAAVSWRRFRAVAPCGACPGGRLRVRRL